MSDKPKVYIGYVHGGNVTHGFMFSMLRTAMWQEAEYIPRVFGQHSGVSIAKHRNKLVGMFLRSECDYWLSIDTDACWAPESVNRLLAHDVPIVAGHALGMDYGSEHTFSAVLDYDEQGDINRRKSIGTGLTKVAGVGMHFTLIRRDVCEKLGNGPGWPFAESIYRNEKAKHYQTVGEDLTFCLRAKEKGDFDTYVDYDCPIGHVKSTVLWPEGTDLDPRAPKEMGIILGGPESSAGFGSHMPSLRAAVQATTGPILELGGGHYSTPYLHEVSNSGRLVVTVETAKDWFDQFAKQYPSEYHRVVKEVPAEPEHFDVVLIDQDPEELRRGALEALRGRFTYAIIHDTQPAVFPVVVWGAYLDSFPYRRDDKPENLPWTTTVSDAREIPEPVGGILP